MNIHHTQITTERDCALSASIMPTSLYLHRNGGKPGFSVDIR